jgi:DNA-binding Xre family transcriptional regulator/molecular chaperone GrpE (heat shock protein)
MLGFILIPGLLYSEFFEMTFSLHQDYTQLLQELMQRLGFSSYRQLSRSAGVSEKQLRRLRSGQISQMRLETLLKLSQALQVSVSELLETFSPESIFPNSPADREEATILLADEASQTVEVLRQEYQRLQQQLEHQRESLIQEFQQSSLEVLESWLVQWPTAAYAAQQNQQLPAVRLLPLVRPVEQLLQQWGVEAIASVGSELAYDPHLHQLMEGTAQPGELVRVRYTGYRIGEKLLYRAKVSPIGNTHKG